MLDPHGTDAREFQFFQKVQDILRPWGLSPAQPGPLEAARMGWPARLPSFRLPYSLLSGSHLEKDWAAPICLSDCGIWEKSRSGSSSCF